MKKDWLFRKTTNVHVLVKGDSYNEAFVAALKGEGEEIGPPSIEIWSQSGGMANFGGGLGTMPMPMPLRSEEEAAPDEDPETKERA